MTFAILSKVPPFSRCSLVFVQSDIIVNISTILILAVHFAVNDCLWFGVHGHHQILSFLPEDALPDLHCSHLELLLVCGL